MKVISFLTIACTILVPLLCTLSCSTVSKEDCKKDMYSLGLSQGRKGLISLSEEIRNVCGKSDPTVSLERYEKGFEKGWNEYCTPLHGYESGKRGDIYKSFCPAAKEDLFREKFYIGKKIYEKKDQVIELEDKIKTSSPNEHDLAAKENLNEMKENLRLLNREIQMLEQNGMNPVHVE
jgi:hypothetical protein